MAIYHLEAKVVSRGLGRSAVAAAAYMSCSQILNEYDGVQHDFTRKRGLVWQQVFLPEYAPAKWQDRGVLWNAVEENEKTKDSRLAREFVAALPIELGKDSWQMLLTEFIQEQFVADGMCADVAIHDTDGHNPHAHIMLTVRPLNEQGKWQYKTEKEYLCVKGSEERGFTAAEFKAAQAGGWEKQYQYKVGKKKMYMAPSAAEAQGYERVSKYPKSTKYGRQNPISERWNSDEQLMAWREKWAETVNQYLAQYPWINTRIDHRSNAARGLDEQPTVHEGYHARKLESMGIVSDRCELNRQIKADNRLFRELRAQIKKLADTVKNTVPALAEAMENLRKSMLIFTYQLLHIRRGIEKMQGYVDAVKPDIDRYSDLQQQIREKSKERKALVSEEKATPGWNLVKRKALSSQISEATEDLEELKSDREWVMNRLDCADEADVTEAKKNVSAIEGSITKLEQSQARFSVERDVTAAQFRSMREQAAAVDPDELMDARLTLRTEKEAEAAERLRAAYGEKFASELLRTSRQEVSDLLGDKLPIRSLKERLHPRQQEQMTTKQKRKQRDQER